MEDKRSPNSRSPSPWPSWLEGEALSGQWEGAVGGSDLPLSQAEEETILNVDADWKHDVDQEPSQCGDANTWEEHGTCQELYPLEAVRVQEHAQWGARRIPGLYQGAEVVRVQELHQWEEDGVMYHEMVQWEEDDVRHKWLIQWEGGVKYREVIQGEGGVSYQEVTQWEEDGVLYQEVAQQEDDGVVYRELSQWPSSPSSGEDEWDDVSVLELSQGEGREERLGIWEAEGLCVPAPREAWAERRAPEPCPAVPGGACPAQLAAQSPRGAAACAALEEQGAEAGTRSQGPAPQSPCCPPSPSPPQLQPQALSGQPAVPKERPSRLRRALRALRSLFRSCLAGQPQD